MPFEVIDAIGDLVREGIPTIKTITTYGFMMDDGHRWGVMNAVREVGGMNVTDAEHDDVARWLTKKHW